MNVKPDEQLIYEKIKNHRGNRVFKLNLEKLKDVREGSYLLIEDIIHLEKKEEKNIRDILNYQAHHKRLKVFCVSHTIYRTSIWSMLPLFHYIVFTGAGSNAPVLRNVLDFFRVERSQADRWLQTFSKLSRESDLSKLKIFFFDCALMSFNYSLNSDLSPPYKQVGAVGVDEEDRGEKAESLLTADVKRKFAKMTQDCRLKSTARSLFDLVVEVLPKQWINQADLSFKFARRGVGNSHVNVSIVDYVMCLIDENGEKPDPGQRALHSLISRSCTLPKLFKANRQFETAQ